MNGGAVCSCHPFNQRDVCLRPSSIQHGRLFTLLICVGVYVAKTNSFFIYTRSNCLGFLARAARGRSRGDLPGSRCGGIDLYTGVGSVARLRRKSCKFFRFN